MSPIKQHYWLTTGHVVFRENDTQRVFRTRDYNGLLKTKKDTVLLKEISGVQHALFGRAVTEVDQTKVETVDMVVTGLMYLGLHAEEEFAAGTGVATAPTSPSEDPPKFQ